VPDTVWWLNDNFTIVGIEGILNMLNGDGCQELNWTWLLPTTLLSWKMFPRTCIGWQSGLCEGGGNHMACLRLFTGLKQPMP
jgi:hypothetical protein